MAYRVHPDEQPGTEAIVFGMGCFWGAQKRMAMVSGVIVTECGYAGGDAESTTYEQVLAREKALRAGVTSQRNHAEVVLVRFATDITDLGQVLQAFWEYHDPTQLDRQGNDVGSNYRSAIYFLSEAQQAVALQSRDSYQVALSKAGYGAIVTEIIPLRHYTPAETYHQDYLQKNPQGYCGLGGTGVKYPR